MIQKEINLQDDIVNIILFPLNRSPARLLSDVFFRGLVLGFIWIAGSCIFFLLGLEAARYLGFISCRRDLTLMILSVPIPGAWVTFLFLAARLLIMPGLLGGLGLGCLYELQSEGQRPREFTLLLFGGLFGFFLGVAAALGVIFIPGIYNLRIGVLFAAGLVIASSFLAILRLSKRRISEV